MHYQNNSVKIELVLIFICFFALIPGLRAEQCPTAYFTREFNKRLTCGLFKTISAQQIDCQSACRDTISCFSVNVYKSENGTDICEMSRGNRKEYGESKACFDSKDNGEYNELTSTDSCSSSQDCPLAPRKALSDGWYQLGLSAFKLFKIKKTYADANATCADNGATLATLNSKLENQFINEVHLAQLKEKNLEATALTPLHHWKLDGSDKDINFYGNATVEQSFASLNLPGHGGAYATSPSFHIHNMSFTIAFWTRVESCADSKYLYSYWANPHMFFFGIVSCRLMFVGRSKLSRDMIVARAGNILNNKWTHATVTWERVAKMFRIYKDGAIVNTRTISDADVDFPTPIRSVFDIGFKRDAGQRGTVKAMLKDLVVFNRGLTGREVALLRDTTGIELKGAWVGTPASSLSNWLPVLTANSQCVLAGAHQMKWDKRDCNDMNEFVCEKQI